MSKASSYTSNKILLTNFNVPKCSCNSFRSSKYVGRCSERDVEVERINEGLLGGFGHRFVRTSGASEMPCLLVLGPKTPDPVLLLLESWTSKLLLDALGGPLGTHCREGKEKKGGEMISAHSYG